MNAAFRQISSLSLSSRLWLVCSLATVIRLACWNLVDVVNRDTVWFIRCAQQLTSTTLRTSFTQEPIHPILIRGVHAVLFPHGTDSGIVNPLSWELAAFLVGIIFTLICIWLLYAITSHLYSPSAGLWAAFFFALQPYAVRYSINGLSELPYTGVMLMGVFLTIKSVAHRRAYLLLAGVCCVLLVLIRKEGIILSAAVVTYLLFQTEVAFRKRFGLILLFLAGILSAMLVYWLMGGRFNWVRDYLTLMTWTRIRQHLFSTVPGVLLASTPVRNPYQLAFDMIAGWVKLSGIVPAALFVVYLFRHKEQTRGSGTGLLLLILCFHLATVFIWASGFGLFVTRYLFPATVVIFPIAFGTLVDLFHSAEHKWAGSSLFLSRAAALAFLPVFVSESLANAWHDRRPEIPAVAKWLVENTPKDAVILAGDNRIGFYCGRLSYPLGNEYAASDFWPVHRFERERWRLVVWIPKKTPRDIEQWKNTLQRNENVAITPAWKLSTAESEVTVFTVQRPAAR